jgi:hypothetical protein
MLFLDKTLYRAFIKLQADRELGRSYAGLLPFVEGLYTMGYLSKEEYMAHQERYNTKLEDKQEGQPLAETLEIKVFTDKIHGYLDSFKKAKSANEWGKAVFSFEKEFPRLLRISKKIADKDATRLLEEAYSAVQLHYEGICATCRLRLEPVNYGKCPLEFASPDGLTSDQTYWFREAIRYTNRKCPKYLEFMKDSEEKRVERS